MTRWHRIARSRLRRTRTQCSTKEVQVAWPRGRRQVINHLQKAATHINPQLKQCGEGKGDANEYAAGHHFGIFGKEDKSQTKDLSSLSARAFKLTWNSGINTKISIVLSAGIMSGENWKPCHKRESICVA